MGSLLSDADKKTTFCCIFRSAAWLSLHFNINYFEAILCVQNSAFTKDREYKTEGMATAEIRCAIGRLFLDAHCGGKIHPFGLCERCVDGIVRTKVSRRFIRTSKQNVSQQANVQRPGRAVHQAKSV